MNKLIGFGAFLTVFGGMGIDGTESKVAYILVEIGLVLMGIATRTLKKEIRL